MTGKRLQSPHHSSRPLFPEVLVQGNEFPLIRRRRIFEKMIVLEEGGGCAP